MAPQQLLQPRLKASWSWVGPQALGCCSSRSSTCHRQLTVARPAVARNVADLPLPDGSLGLPIVGETLDLVTSGDTFGSTRRQRYGDIYKTQLLGAPTVMVYGEDAVRTVLAAEDKLVASDWPSVTSTLVGPRSLNLLSGTQHGAVKRALAEAFSERQVRRLVPRMAALVQDYVGRWAAEPQPLGGYAACQELSQAVFGAVVLGGDGGRRQAGELQGIMAALAGGFLAPPLDLPFTDYGKAVAARRRFGELSREAIARCRGAAGQAPSCCLAAVVAAADAAGEGRLLTDDIIEDNLVAGFFGNASTGPSLAKALQYVGANTHVLEALRQEQQAVVAKHGADITAEALDDMPYGTTVVRELLRITPAVPAVFRVALEDFELQGRRIPKGWRVWCHLGDAVVKYNKDTFAPERWTGSGQPAPSSTPASAAGPAAGCPMHSSGAGAGSPAAVGPEYTLPFGSGVRTCLGQHLVQAQLGVLLAVLARGYTWRVEQPAEEWRLVPTPAPKDGLRVQVQRLA